MIKCTPMIEVYKSYIYIYIYIAIRKLSAKFLLLLLYKSEHCQRLFSEQFDLTPISGLICLNRIPQTVKKKMRENPSIFIGRLGYMI